MLLLHGQAAAMPGQADAVALPACLLPLPQPPALGDHPHASSPPPSPGSARPASLLPQVLMATNRPDTLDPALLRPGRLDRKVEFGLPDLEGRAQIFKIHTRTMNIERDIR